MDVCKGKYSNMREIASHTWYFFFQMWYHNAIWFQFGGISTVGRCFSVKLSKHWKKKKKTNKILIFTRVYSRVLYNAGDGLEPRDVDDIPLYHSEVEHSWQICSHISLILIKKLIQLNKKRSKFFIFIVEGYTTQHYYRRKKLLHQIWTQ